MARRRKKKLRLKYKVRRFIFLIIVLLIIYLIYSLIVSIFGSEEEVKENNNKIVNNSSVINITNDSESDSDVIDTIFMDGLSLEDFNNILDYKPKVINQNKKYTNIEYDFETTKHYSYLESIYKKLSNSDIVHVEVIGKSVDNRNIYGIEIGKGKDTIFIDANIHAAEVANTLILTRFLSELVNDYEANEENIVQMLNNVKIAAIPCLNPDGYEIYNYGVESLNNKDLWVYENRNKINFDNIKSNANGVDLNRNFPTQNVGLYYKGNRLISNTSITKTFEKGKYYNGESAGSEPETRAAMYFMLKHYKNTIYYVNMHTQGRVIYAGKPNLSDEFNDLTIAFANNINSINGYKVNGLDDEEVGEGNDGSATDFMSELAHGFKFSTKTLRLSTDKYIDNSATLKYKYPVITLETTKVWTRDTSFFKKEYYDNGIRDMLYKLIEKEL